MPDVPRDPRQLARDILAGKISIEELAREQQRRAAGGAVNPPRPPQARMPERIPLPRQVQPKAQPKPQPQRPVIRKAPPPPRPTPRPPVIKTQPARRPEIAPAPQLQPLPTARPAPVAAVTAVVAAETSAQKTGKSNENIALARIMKNRAALRQSIIMAEVLGKPVALREDW